LSQSPEEATVFSADPKTIQRMAPRIERALVIEPVAGMARLLTDLLKDMGSRQVLTASRTESALAIAKEFDPQLILVEFAGPELDGLDFTRRLRRSAFACRQQPVIMVTAEATASSIVGARNAGVHEFLRKPYTAGDLFRRVFCSFSKARTSIWRTRSRLTPYCAARSSSVVGSSFRRRSVRMCRSRSFSVAWRVSSVIRWPCALRSRPARSPG
jgi:DNA-binding response OmpR family regulator